MRATDNISSVYVEHKSRTSGHSNYTLGKLIHLWLSMFVNFSIKPMRMMMSIGTFVLLASLAFAVYFIVDKILHPDVASGWTSLGCIILFIGGLQTIFLGLIGEYIGKNYLDQNGTPQWTVKEVFKSKEIKD